MFTGVIKDLASIFSIEKEGNGKVFGLRVPIAISKSLKEGDSLSINGVCQTVIARDPAQSVISVFSSCETLTITNLQYLKINNFVNLELPLKPLDFINGHLIQGHIETMERLVSIVCNESSYLFKFRILDQQQEIFILKKASIAIDGISLTVYDKQDAAEFIDIEVMIIPTTMKKTIFQYYKLNDLVNVETDMIAKYLYQFVSSKR